MTDNAWHWWQSALDNKRDIGQPHLPVSVDSPEQGFFKMRWNAQKPWLPVAIWKDGDEWIALRAGRKVDPLEAWNYCCRHPITSEAYEQALAGQGWADDDPTVAAAIGPGHNVEGKDELEILADEIESAKQGANAYLDIQTDDEAAKAQSLRSRMNELAGTADKRREELKKPHFEAGKAIDKLWMPLVKDAKSIADALRKHIEVFKTAQLLERRRLELERQRAEAEREVGLTEAPPPPLPPIDTTVKGSYGRAASVRMRWVVTGIKDWDAAIAQYRGDSRLIAALMKMAQDDVNAGQQPAGFVMEEQAVIS